MKKDKKIEEATAMREKGFSFREISEKLHIAKSTTSLWLRKVDVSKLGKKRIMKLRADGNAKGLAKLKKIKDEENKAIHQKTENLFKTFSKLGNDKVISKIICSVLYWCEGGKLDKGRVSFINSDPEMISYFLRVFRHSFDIDESKFRGLVHLHSYHNPKVQTKFWSEITGIPPKQFSKSFLKANSGKIKRKNYPGCLSIRYYDSKIKKEMIDIYKTLVKKTAGVV